MNKIKINAAHLNRAGHCNRNIQAPPTAMAMSQPSFDPVQKNPAPPRKSASAMTAARIVGRNRFVLLKANTSETGNSSRIAPANAFG